LSFIQTQSDAQELTNKAQKKSFINRKENNNILKTRNIITAIYLLQVNKNKDVTQ